MSDSYMLRLPDGMRDRIRQRATANRRSMNSEIVYHLDRALAENEKGPVRTAILPSQEHDPIPSEGQSYDRSGR